MVIVELTEKELDVLVDLAEAGLAATADCGDLSLVEAALNKLRGAKPVEPR